MQVQLLDVCAAAIMQLQKRVRIKTYPHPTEEVVASCQQEQLQQLQRMRQQRSTGAKVMRTTMSFQDKVRLFDENEPEGFNQLVLANVARCQAAEILNVCVQALCDNKHPDQTAWESSQAAQMFPFCVQAFNDDNEHPNQTVRLIESLRMSHDNEIISTCAIMAKVREYTRICRAEEIRLREAAERRRRERDQQRK